MFARVRESCFWSISLAFLKGLLWKPQTVALGRCPSVPRDQLMRLLHSMVAGLYQPQASSCRKYHKLPLFIRLYCLLLCYAKGEYLCISWALELNSSPTFCDNSKTTIGKHIGIATRRECIGTTFYSVGKLPPIYFSINDTLSNTVPAKRSTLQNQGHSWRAPIRNCREVRPCRTFAFLVADLSGTALRALTCPCCFCRRNRCCVGSSWLGLPANVP